VVHRIRGRRRQNELAGSTIVFESSHEFAAEELRRGPDGDEETVAAFAELEIPGKTCARDDAVDMRMEGKVLTPCMENLDDTGLCAKIASVTSQSQKCLSSCLMEQ
jgi:hypothetical protein